MSNIVYHYDRSTGMFLGIGQAEINPRRPDSYLPPPAFATTVQPPVEIPAGQAAFFVEADESWVLRMVDPSVVNEPATLTPEEQLMVYRVQVQEHLDRQAQSMGYDNIATAVTYADEPAVAKFQAEGAALRAWRSLVWAHCYEVLAQVQAQVREAPSMEELLEEMPAFAMLMVDTGDAA